MLSNQPGMTVSVLVDLLREVVESNFVSVTVEGEVSNLGLPASGHWYFTLKDSRSQLRSVMFRGRNRLCPTRPHDGMRVVCRGSVSIYGARGEVQLIVEDLLPAGLGDLQAAFNLLKQRLAAEGLFEPSRKRLLPEFPLTVGVVTSATGAAIHDILNVLRRRAAGLRVVVCPVRVQGEGAATEIAEALAALNVQGQCDVLIVGRGGGSLEDLWAFNEETVVRAIAASRIPVISAVGHDVDVTLADLVADLRAATPSAAAELVAKSRLELEAHLDHLVVRLQSCLRQSLLLLGERLNGYEFRLDVATRRFAERRQTVAQLQHCLERNMRDVLRQFCERVASATGRLDALSPLEQLARGYAIVSRDRDGRGLCTAGQLEIGDPLWIRFAQGYALSRVEKVEK